MGSGTVVVAPNTIADGATTGAGAVVTRNAGIGRGEVWVGVPARRLEKSRKPATAAIAGRKLARTPAKVRKRRMPVARKHAAAHKSAK